MYRHPPVAFHSRASLVCLMSSISVLLCILGALSAVTRTWSASESVIAITILFHATTIPASYCLTYLLLQMYDLSVDPIVMVGVCVGTWKFALSNCTQWLSKFKFQLPRHILSPTSSFCKGAIKQYGTTALVCANMCLQSLFQ